MKSGSTDQGPEEERQGGQGGQGRQGRAEDNQGGNAGQESRDVDDSVLPSRSFEQLFR